MGETILEVEDLAKTYAVGKRVVRALDGVDLAVAPGESVAIVGESGSGKTTLAKMVLGVEAPSPGRIVFDGAELGPRRDRRLRRRIQVVQQNPLSTLNPKRTIRQAIELPLRVHGMVPSGNYAEPVAELLDIVGLPPEYMSRYPSALSGGQLRVDAVTRADVARWFHEYGQHRPGGANRAHDTLRDMFNRAMAWGHRSEAAGNPCTGITRYRRPPRGRLLGGGRSGAARGGAAALRVRFSG